MTVFKLQKFPHVCRLCLEPDSGGVMFSVDSADPALEWATIREYLATFTVPIAEIKIHMKRHLNQREYNCKYCQKTFKAHSDVMAHIREGHIASRKFICGTCGLEFKRKSILQEHELRDVYNYTCQICGKKFKISSALHNHIKKVHTEKKHACKLCEKKFHVQYLYLDHVENVHGIKMRFFCDVCVQLFFSQETLDAHLVCHNEPKELQCGTCLEVFETQQEMSDHLCITFRDDYVCCGKDLRYHKMYNRHMFIEHGQKTNVRVKQDQSQLYGRIRSTRKRIEVCPKCKQTFATRTQKKRHMEICGNEPEPEDSWNPSTID